MIIYDITSWKHDVQHGIFPIGARDKEMLWSPNSNIRGIKPEWPYLFKESINRYPDQFWTEVVAYIISKHLGVSAPVAFPAFKQTQEGIICGSLIEWFYNVNTEKFVHAGDFFKKLLPEFDSKEGRQHNFPDMLKLIKTFRVYESLRNSSTNWVIEMALFDSFIGNTDRHQDNWGFIFKDDSSVELSPLFDNGTSLGHERFIEHVITWEPKRIEDYIKRGKHHLRYDRDSNIRIEHFKIIEAIVDNQTDKEFLVNKIKGLNFNFMMSEIRELVDINIDVPFTEERYDWIEKILEVRLQLIEDKLK